MCVDILKVSEVASTAEIRSAYLKQAKMYHPDVNKSTEAKKKFAEINEAHETLKDENKRRIYD
jgi:molecular chaperone DnaJ